MQYEQIIWEQEGSIVRLILNRPDIRNAVTGEEMIGEIEDACMQINKDQEVKVLILTGKDPAFSSGGNIKDMLHKRGMFAGNAEQIMEGYRRQVQRIPRAVFNVEVPSIAAVNGPAVGAGCDLALMCDMRVASTQARFAESFLSVGLIPGDGGAFFLPRVVGQAKAAEMTFTARTVFAEEAAEMGLVNRMVEHEELVPRAMELARQIADKPGAALRMSKRLLRLSQSSSMEQMLEQSAAYQALCHSTQEHLKALQDMLGK